MRVVIGEETRIDILAKQLLGTERDGATEALLAANPGLAVQGPYVAAGTELTVPPRPPRPSAPVVNPWN